ncbi:MAG: DUF2116 family Zn-ribbon domain-containing protein [Bacillota bacterium]
MKNKCKNCDKKIESEYEEKFCSNKCWKQYKKERLRKRSLVMK